MLRCLIPPRYDSSKTRAPSPGPGLWLPAAEGSAPHGHVLDAAGIWLKLFATIRTSEVFTWMIKQNAGADKKYPNRKKKLILIYTCFDCLSAMHFIARFPVLVFNANRSGAAPHPLPPPPPTRISNSGHRIFTITPCRAEAWPADRWKPF